MKNLFFLLSFTVTTFSYAQFSTQTMMVGAESRTFRQYLPSGFNPGTETGLPLIIAMHGLGDNAANFSGVGFQYIADTARFIVTYLQGTANAFGQNSWNNGTAFLSTTSDDLGFINQVIDSMYVKYNIDLNRVYVCGFSMGGIMSYHTVCALPHRIAAMASVSGTMSDADVSSCNPGRVVPVMHMHGTSDGTVPYDGAALPSLSLVPTTMAFWQNNNGCSDSTVYNLPDLVPADSITVDTIVYSSCNAPVNLWRENGADHQWLYTPVNDVDATTEIWKFFRTKVHPGASQLGIEEGNAVKPVIKIANHQLSVTSAELVDEIHIMDVQGRLLMNFQVNNTDFETMLPYIPTGIFLVSVYTTGHITTQKFIIEP